MNAENEKFDYNKYDYNFIGEIPENKLPEAYQTKIPPFLPYILWASMGGIVIFGVVVIRYFIITWNMGS